MSFINKTFSIFTNRIYIALVSFVMSIILARLLGPEKLGVITIIMLIPVYYEKFGKMGLGLAANYKISKGEIKAEDAASILLFVAFTVGLLPALFFYTYNNYFVSVFLENIVVFDWYFLAILFTLPAVFVQNFFLNIFVSKEDVKSLTQTRLLTGILPGALSIVLLLFSSLDIGAVILSTAVVNVLVLVFILYRYNILFQTLPTVGFNTKHFTDLMKYGRQVYLRSIIIFIHYRSDLIIVAFLLNASQVAFYKLASSFSEKIWQLNVTHTLILPRVAASNENYGIELAARVFKSTFWMMFVVSMLIFWFSAALIKFLYGEQFMPLVEPLKLLLPGVVAIGASNSIAHYYLAKNQLKLFNIIYAVSIFINIALNIIMIPIWKLNGAAIATSFTYILSTMIIVILFAREDNVNLKKLFIIDQVDVDHYKKLLKSILATKI